MSYCSSSRLAFFATWAVALAVPAHAQSPHFDLPPPPSGTVEKVLASIITGKPLPAEQASEQPDPHLRGVWGGNKSAVSAYLKAAHVKFLREEEARSSTLNVSFEFGAAGIEIDLKNGERKPVIVRPGAREIIPAALSDNSRISLLAMAAPFTAHGVRALVLCPLGVSGERPAPGNFTISQAQYIVGGQAKGSVLSGFGPGLAEGWLVTTKSVTPTTEYYDRAFEKDPAVTLRYRTVSGYKPSGEPTSGGIRAELDLQNNAGYRWVLRELDTAHFVKFEVPEALEDDLGLSSEEQPASCFLLYKQRERLDRYTKEPLQTPR